MSRAARLLPANWLRRLIAGSVRRQLMLVVALVHAVLMTLFVFDLVERQSRFLHKQSVAQAVSLSDTLATNSTSWVLANDIIGLEEVLASLKNYPELRYAMVVDPTGRVIAHSNSDHTGRYLADPVSLRLLDTPTEPVILIEDEWIIDVATPIIQSGQQIAWARISIGQEESRQGLELVTYKGIVYTVIAIVVGLLVAWLMARGLTRGLYQLIAVADATRSGIRDLRADSDRVDEIGQLATGFNRMLDALVREERLLTDASERLGRMNSELERRVEQRTSELSESNRRLTTAIATAEEANRAKGLFLASVSHELRTPLNAILGFTQLIRRQASLPSDQQDNLVMIQRSGEHLLGLINNVLDMSKIEAGRMELENQPANLHQAIRNVVDMVEIRAAEKGIAFRSRIAEELPQWFEFDSAKLRQILINLLGNAIKFTDHGGVTLTVDGQPVDKPEGEVANEYWQIRIVVEDSGPGIEPGEREQVFSPFTQGSGGREGTGLGLAISRDFIRQMGGSISLESEVGVGCRFVITVDLAPTADESLESEQNGARVIALSPGQPAWRILVVDDAPANRILLTRLLSGVGFTVRDASNGLDALRICEEWCPDLVWMDLRMPGMDGLEASRRIHQTPGCEECVVLALTASVVIGERDEILRHGIADILRKPFRETDLFDAMARQLGVSYLYEELNDSKSGGSNTGLVDHEERLSKLDLQLRESLIRQLRAGDIEAIDRSLELVSHQDRALGAWMAARAAHFSYDELLAALDGKHD